jgi:response regulator RpfG family c-di-GMP phosphodiesterase
MIDISGIKAVSVDDDSNNLELIEDLCGETGIHVKSFKSPFRAVDYIRENETDLIFVDYNMPGINGIELVEEIREIQSDVPIIMITAVANDQMLKLNAVKAGVTDFLTKPLSVEEFIARVKNLSRLRAATLLIKDKAKLLDSQVQKTISEVKSREYETLKVLGKAAEYRDSDTGFHIQRVAGYSRILSEFSGGDDNSGEILYYAAPLHDVGKIGISDSILLKPSGLDKNEFDEIKKHTTIGYNILKNQKSEYLRAGAMIALTHHEKYDGTGYPSGLKGKDIHIFGRIVAIADVFDALTSERPYKKRWELGEAFSYLKENRGTQFDPHLTDLFLANSDAVKKIYDEFSE